MQRRRTGLAISLVVLLLGIAYVIYVIQSQDQGQSQDQVQSQDQGQSEDQGPGFLEATGPEAIDLGERVYAENCAACHGANLEGEPGFDWQRKKPDGTFPAPPHDETGRTWHHADTLLFTYTTNGGQVFLGDTGVSGMPAFADVLTVHEIEAVLIFIKSSWPESIRERQRLITETQREK